MMHRFAQSSNHRSPDSNDSRVVFRGSSNTRCGNVFPVTLLGIPLPSPRDTFQSPVFLLLVSDSSVSDWIHQHVVEQQYGSRKAQPSAKIDISMEYLRKLLDWVFHHVGIEMLWLLEWNLLLPTWWMSDKKEIDLSDCSTCWKWTYRAAAFFAKGSFEAASILFVAPALSSDWPLAPALTDFLLLNNEWICCSI